MRADSAVLVAIQRPLAFFGIAPTLLSLVGAAGAIGVVASVLSGIIALALPLSVTLMGGAWAIFWRATRRDHHFDRRLFMAPRFWRGRRRKRALLAGGRP